MKNNIQVVLLVFFTLFLGRQSFAQAEEQITLIIDSGDIHGTLLTPKTAQKVPVVLFIVGSGPTDRDGNPGQMKNNSLKYLAEALQENGIATLRYDKRGIAGSSKALDSIQNLRFDHWVDDAKGWVQLLKKRNEFSSMTIAGHSQGSLVGILAAQAGDVDKYISIAGAGVPINETIEQQLQDNAPVAVAMAKPLLDSLAQGHRVKHVPPMLMSLFAPYIQPFMISWMKYNPVEEIKKLDIPCLIVQGTTDLQVKEEDANKLKAATSNAQLLIIQKMNHVLKESSDNLSENMATYNNPDLPVVKEIVDGIVGFVKNTK